VNHYLPGGKLKSYRLVAAAFGATATPKETLLKRHPIKDNIRGKMIRCMLDTDFLTEVLTLQ
jgi:hypothetical protein